MKIIFYVIKKVSICIFLILLLLWLAYSIPVSTKKGINCVVHERKIPLLIKAIEFTLRDYEYRRLSGDIVEGCKNDYEKIQAIFQWVRNNIKSGTPEGMPVVDDHILNIIIRGYGQKDQVEDVFVTLCGYAGLEACRTNFTPKGVTGRKLLPISLVKIDGKWYVFDIFFGNYFFNEKNEFASIEDIIRNPKIIDKAKSKPVVRGIRYKDYFNNLAAIEIDAPHILRTKKQMPLPRLMLEVKKIIKR